MSNQRGRKQIRVIFHTLVVDHKCDSDRHAWTITHCRVHADEQKSFKLSRELLRPHLVSHTCQAKAGRTVGKKLIGLES